MKQIVSNGSSVFLIIYILVKILICIVDETEKKRLDCVVHCIDNDPCIKGDGENRLIKSRTSMAITGNLGSKIPLLNLGSRTIRCTSWAGSDLNKACTQLRMQCQQQYQNQPNKTGDNDANLINKKNNSSDCEHNNNSSNININKYNKRNIVHVEADVVAVPNESMLIRKTNAFHRPNLMRLTPGLCLAPFSIVC